jgi:RNA polymerase sigma-70 factor (family 1)
MGNGSSDNEVRLVISLSKGNILAFNALFKEYSSKLYRFAMKYLKSEEDAEELVQEVFTIVWEKRKELKAELSFRSYLFTISFNIIRKHFRTRAMVMEYFRTSNLADIDHKTMESISYESLNEYIKVLIEKLPDKRKDIFIRSRMQGQSIKEIAESLGISHKTVENQISSALKTIRISLEKEGIALVLFFYLFFL